MLLPPVHATFTDWLEVLARESQLDVRWSGNPTAHSLSSASARQWGGKLQGKVFLAHCQSEPSTYTCKSTNADACQLVKNGGHREIVFLERHKKLDRIGCRRPASRMMAKVWHWSSQNSGGRKVKTKCLWTGVIWWLYWPTQMLIVPWKGTSLVCIASKLLGNIIVGRLPSVHEEGAHAYQTDFRSSWGCIVHSNATLKVSEYRHASRRSTISVFPNPKAVFDWIGRAILWRRNLSKDVTEEFISLSNLCARKVEAEFVLAINPHPSSRDALFVRVSLSNSVIDLMMEIAPSSFENIGIDIWLDRKLSDLEYADEVVLSREDSSGLYVLLEHLLKITPSKICNCCHAKIRYLSR